jgi:hypothetical protein
MKLNLEKIKVEHSELTLCIQFIDIMPLFRYI